MEIHYKGYDLVIEKIQPRLMEVVRCKASFIDDVELQQAEAMELMDMVQITYGTDHYIKMPTLLAENLNLVIAVIEGNKQ